MKIFSAEQFETIQQAQRQNQQPPTKKFSKLKILRQLKDLNAWEAVKSSIESAGLMDEWLVAQELASDDAQFMEMLNGLNLNGINPKEILANAEITEE